MKTSETDTSLYCHPGDRKTKGRRMLVRKRVVQYRNVKVRAFAVLPEWCPAGLELACSSCEHSQNQFRVRKQTRSADAGHGMVRCTYSAQNDPA